MILPIYLYGSSVLRKAGEEISADYPDLKGLVDNMFETMYNANGVGLAAPQIGLSIRLLVIDLAPFKEEDPELGAFKTVMINPEMLETSEKTASDEEGCLSIPGVHENVIRPVKIKIRYRDENFVERIEEFEGYKARVIQHEYDHIEGKLFTDKVSPIRRQLIKSKLDNIARGKFSCSYKTKSQR
ncbi:MAG: peptide deformylase [Prevotellaceae bacterium]|jgi:peptide deformylase|nr:peptide deformylase [Prevotellaceae bacterium]